MFDSFKPRLVGARELMVVAIMGMVAYAIVRNPKDQILIGALIGQFAAVVSFYFGSSKKEDPSSPVPVSVENSLTNPVPVSDAEPIG